MITRLSDVTWLDCDEVAAVVNDVGLFGSRPESCVVVLKSGQRIPFLGTAERVARAIRGQQS